MMSGLTKFLFDDEGTAAVEYAIMLSLLLLVVISTVLTLGTKTNSAFGNTARLL
jgi:Flp pilus assembly pilin Flp